MVCARVVADRVPDLLTLSRSLFLLSGEKGKRAGGRSPPSRSFPVPSPPPPFLLPRSGRRLIAPAAAVPLLRPRTPPARRPSRDRTRSPKGCRMAAACSVRSDDAQDLPDPALRSFLSPPPQRRFPSDSCCSLAVVFFFFFGGGKAAQSLAYLCAVAGSRQSLCCRVTTAAQKAGRRGRRRRRWRWRWREGTREEEGKEKKSLASSGGGCFCLGPARSRPGQGD